MDKYSVFIKDKVLFGSYPSQEDVYFLEKNGVTWFVNLTYNNERNIKPYTSNYNVLKFSIKDRNIPKDMIKWKTFLLKLKDIIDNLNDNEKMYIHCRGGHGRSCLTISCLACLIYNIKPLESIKQTTIMHNKRTTVKRDWPQPQSFKQMNFVEDLFNNK
ncbi:hypothetical protein AGMMS49579_03920 [Spirochaetia bacterium]|nr:hypothetical protein AGMMS49579_03920 [Spirochaetia bacterium]